MEVYNGVATNTPVCILHEFCRHYLKANLEFNTRVTS